MLYKCKVFTVTFYKSNASLKNPKIITFKKSYLPQAGIRILLQESGTGKQALINIYKIVHQYIKET